MMNVVQASGGTVWFLNDPIEDNPNHSWDDYKTNWESTLTASLLWPQVWRYEVMPWPERIFRGRYPTVDAPGASPASRSTKVPIPPAYATELMTVINALNDMDQKEIAWDCGTRGHRRRRLRHDDVPARRAEPVRRATWARSTAWRCRCSSTASPPSPSSSRTRRSPARSTIKVLLMTYEGMKPMTPDVHDALADWVKNGGAPRLPRRRLRPVQRRPRLVERPQGEDELQGAPGTPVRGLGLAKSLSSGKYATGKGTLIYDQRSPATLAYQKEGAGQVRELARLACQLSGLDYRETNYLVLRRGPYVIAAGLDESISAEPKDPSWTFYQLV